jgi:hypothetical protein
VDDTSTATATLDQADEDILIYDVSDEALEAAAATDSRGPTVAITSAPCICQPFCNR